MLSARQVRHLVLALAVCAASSVSTAHAQQVAVSAVKANVTVQDTVATATFRVQVVNKEDAATMTDFRIVYSDGTELRVGDVAPAATVVSDEDTRIVDLSGAPSRSIAFNVTLRFYINDTAVEMPWVITVQRPQ